MTLLMIITQIVFWLIIVLGVLIRQHYEQQIVAYRRLLDAHRLSMDRHNYKRNNRVI